MHDKWKEIWYCLRNNQWNIIWDQLLMKSPVKLEDNSNKDELKIGDV